MDQNEVDKSFYAIHTALIHKRVAGFNSWRELFHLIGQSGVVHNAETHYNLEVFAKLINDKFVK